MTIKQVITLLWNTDKWKNKNVSLKPSDNIFLNMYWWKLKVVTLKKLKLNTSETCQKFMNSSTFVWFKR